MSVSKVDSASCAPWAAWSFRIFLVAYALLGLVTLTDGHRWGDDWAQYVLHARNLASGLSYSDTGYLFNPDFASVGPPTYPPGFPALLAPVVAIAGVDLIALKAVGLVCIVLSLSVAARLFAPVIGPSQAIVAVMLFALHPAVWQMKENIQSETPYILFSLLALWWAARPNPVERPGAPAALSPAIEAVTLGVLVYACVSIRSVGIALLPALAVFGWARRKPLGWFAGVGVSFALLVWVQASQLVEPTTYQGQLNIPTVGFVLEKPGGYLHELGYLFPAPFGLSRFSALVVVIAALAGAWFACVRSVSGLPELGLVRSWVARVPLFVWYLGAYFAGLVAVPVSPDSRLLLPVLPIVFALAVHGACAIAGRMRLPPQVLQVAGVAFAAYLFALLMSGRHSPEEDSATCDDCRRMYAFIGEATSRDEVVVFNKPRAMALLGGRPSWRPSGRYTPEELQRGLDRVRASVVVVGAPGSDFARSHPAAPALEARIQEPDAKVVYRNAGFVVVRIGSSGRT